MKTMTMWVLVASLTATQTIAQEKKENFDSDFKDFGKAFQDFDKSFAKMDEDFKNAFKGFEESFQVGFKNFNADFNMNNDDSKFNEGAITAQQREYAIGELKRTKMFLEKELKGLSDEQLKFKPSSEKWSIAEITEHIALSENGIFQVLQGSLKTPADSAKRSEIRVSDVEISKRLTNRTFKAQSPEVIKPTGKFSTTQAAFQAFTTRRDATIDYVGSTNDDLQNHFWKHIATGTIDLYQTILLISAHSERHILQIVEVKANEGFPVK